MAGAWSPDLLRSGGVGPAKVAVFHGLMLTGLLMLGPAAAIRPSSAGPPSSAAPPRAPDPLEAPQVEPAPPPPPTAPAGSALRELDPPLTVRLRLADGATISGQVTAWSWDGLLGSFGHRRWTDVRPADTMALASRLMNQGSADEWIALGRTLLLSPKGASLAENAFRKARGLDPTAEERIAQVRAEAAERAAAPADADPGDRLRLDDPEGRPWPTTPWRDLDAAERTAALDVLRQDAAAVLQLAGLKLRALETERLLLHSDGPKEETARLAVRLERAIDEVEALVGSGNAVPELFGKAVVIVTSDRAAFRRLQERVFLQLDRPDVTAMCHCIGTKVIVVVYAGAGGDELLAPAARELVHGVLHRYVSPVRLPPWANEGLAALVAARVAPDASEPKAERRKALEFIRAGGDAWKVVESGYADPGWPGPQAVGPGLGRLLVEGMVRERPIPFAAWATAVKRGADWREAMREVFGVSWPGVVRSLVEWHRFND